MILSRNFDNIANGSLTATADQQPYHQGYMSVTMVAQYLKYGLLPADMNTGGTCQLINLMLNQHLNGLV